MRRVLRAFASARRLPLLASALAVLLVLPSLTAGLLVDDYVHKMILQRSWGPIPISNAPWDLFRFVGAGQAASLTDYGVLPWWTNLGATIAFWRPVSSATHWLDYHLWPNSPPLMHAQSIAWYALVVALTTILYLRISGHTAAAALAAILFAIDSAHATPVVFLANRNTLVAAVFGILCVLFHDRSRKSGSRRFALFAVGMFAVALLAKEEAICICGYLAAFALFLDTGSPRTRLLSLLPYALVVAAWRIAWLRLGYGVSANALYIDPLQEPLTFMHAAIQRIPVLLLSQVSKIPADLSLAFRGLGLVSIAAALTVLALALLAWPAIRRDSITRFWLAGMLISIVPAAATLPSDRMLFFPGIGAIALIAQLIATVILGQKPAVPFAGRTRTAIVWVLAAVNLVLSPIFLAARTAAPALLRQRIDAICTATPLEPAVRQQDLIIVNAPLGVASSWTLASTWAADHAPLPRHFRILCSSLFRPVEVRRPDERTLVLRPDAGFLTGLDRAFCGKDMQLPLGWTRELTGCQVKVTAATPDGRPMEVAFRFSLPLTDSSFRWMQWKNGRYIPFTPPAVGESVTLR